VGAHGKVGRRLARDLRVGRGIALFGDQRQFYGGPDSRFAGPGAEPRASRSDSVMLAQASSMDPGRSRSSTRLRPIAVGITWPVGVGSCGLLLGLW
jgi:hypothetical protein